MVELPLSSEIEKRNFQAMTKIKVKEKEGYRVEVMNKKINKELQFIIDSYH